VYGKIPREAIITEGKETGLKKKKKGRSSGQALQKEQ
jgi:hypothetical protein